MPAAAQASLADVASEYSSGRFSRLAGAITKSRSTVKDDYGFNALLASFSKPANDDPELDALLDTLDEAIPADEFDLDALLADLPCELEAVPAPVVTDLDGNPVEEDLTPRTPSPRSPRRLAKNPKRAPAKSRTTYARDFRNLSQIKGFVPDVRPLMATAPGSPLVAGTTTPSTRSSPTSSTPSTTPTTTPSNSTLKRRNADENDTRAAPSWDRTTDIIKGHAYVRTVSVTGVGIPWSLNLGDKLQKVANDNPTKIKAILHDRLQKALKAILGTARDFVFGIEATKDGRWHLHGVVDGREDERPFIEEAARRAGGTWGAETHADKQAHTGILWGPDGWARYLMKGMAATKRQLGIKSVLSVTRGCRSRAEELWERSRRLSPSVD